MDTQEIATAADTYIDSGASDTAYGGDDSLYIERWIEGRLMRILLRFETAAIPSGATVMAAEILMNGGPLDRAGTIAIHRLLRAWDESSATWDASASGSPWTTPGGDMDPTPLAAVFLPARSTSPIWDVLLDVQRFLSGELENYGWLLRDNEESNRDTALSFAFDSRTSTNFADRPRLRIRYCFNCDLCL